MSKRKAIVVDLDWTLCELWDSSNPYNHDWEEIIIPWMCTMINSMYIYNQDTIILTGRKKNEYQSVTVKWLSDNGILHDRLIMQEWNTAEKNHVFKKKKLEELKEQYDILFVVDDNPDMIPVCKELWITLLAVHTSENTFSIFRKLPIKCVTNNEPTIKIFNRWEYWNPKWMNLVTSCWMPSNTLRKVFEILISI